MQLLLGSHSAVTRVQLIACAGLSAPPYAKHTIFTPGQMKEPKTEKWNITKTLSPFCREAPGVLCARPA